MAARLTAMERMVLTVKAVSDYENGDTIMEIAKRYGHQARTIQSVLRGAGVKMRPKGRRPLDD